MKRIVVLGTVRFSARCFEALMDSGANVAGVITGDDRSLARHSDRCSLAPYAAGAGVPCLAVHDVNTPEVLDWLRERAPDVLLVVGWSQLLSTAVTSIPSLASIGSHPTLLPEGRGRHPIVWTLVHGLRRSGLTFFVLAAEADAGDILIQDSFEIGNDDDASTVYDAVERLGMRMMPPLLDAIERGLPDRRPQDSRAATVYRKRTERDGEIDWRAPAAEIRNLIRALTSPYPGAHTFLRRGGSRRVTIWRASISDGPGDIAPGGIVLRDNLPIVRAGDGWLQLDRYTSPALLASGDTLGSLPL
jgi:methionyl-tRNA formyltransferase